MNNKIEIYDSTLRDGAQGEGISFTIEDKLKIIKALDDFGVTYIEAGNPASNPKDYIMFEKLKSVNINSSKIVAFGSTRHIGIESENDENLKKLIKAGTEYVAIFGKAWDKHVYHVLGTSLEENLKMISDSIAFLIRNNKKVIFDAEHFFDGYKSNKDYAIKTIQTAIESGAESICLCDTNGGTYITEIGDITKDIVNLFNGVQIGIHCHNDNSLAVANSLVATQNGASMIQGTFIGFGERCGNANLSSIIPNLQLKMGFECVSNTNLKKLTETARFIADISNVSISSNKPFIGSSSFAHKAGMHIDGINKMENAFEHIIPEIVGNHRRVLYSEMAGRASIVSKLQEVDDNITKDDIYTELVLDKLKEKELEGYQYEVAGASFEILIRKVLKKYTPFFKLIQLKTINENPAKDGEEGSSVMIKINVGDKSEITAAQGDGPVHAMDTALRKALCVFYPSLKEMTLTDYKVRVLEGNDATAALVRVLIESTDGKSTWTTVGVSRDIIEASWIALVDSFEYKLIREFENN